MGQTVGPPRVSYETEFGAFSFNRLGQSMQITAHGPKLRFSSTDLLFESTPCKFNHVETDLVSDCRKALFKTVS